MHIEKCRLGSGERVTPAEKVRVIQKLSWDYKLDIPLEIAQLPRFTFYDHNQQQS